MENNEIVDTIFKMPKVTKVEVIHNSPLFTFGSWRRVFKRKNLTDVEIQYYDGGKTLKLFIK